MITIFIQAYYRKKHGIIIMHIQKENYGIIRVLFDTFFDSDNEVLVVTKINQTSFIVI